MIEEFLPVQIIPRGKRVILYGAGKIGKQYYKQNQELEWCNIIAAADRNGRKIIGFPVVVITPEEICRYEYDYILIARSSIAGEKEHEAITEYLVDLGIDRGRILSNTACHLWSKKNTVVIDESEVSESFADPYLRVAFLVRNTTIGDHIISLKLFQTIAVQMENGTIDVFSSNVGTAEAIYYGQEKLGKICRSSNWKEDSDLQYDLAIMFGFEPSLLYARIRSVERKAPRLAECVWRLNDFQEQNGVEGLIGPYVNSVQINRARFWGRNRYTLLSCNGVFDIVDQHVDLYMNEEYAGRFSDLGLDHSYITFSYGAGGSPKKGVYQTKAWPREHFERLIRLIKENYGSIQVIQLGSSGAERVRGADRYLFGEKLETVKYILRDALLHVDCESGLVHLATQLGTKCVVMFGPTEMWFYKYDENENIVPEECGGCEGLIPDWYFRCFNYEKPRCMASIKAEIVFEKLDGCLRKRGYK